MTNLDVRKSVESLLKSLNTNIDDGISMFYHREIKYSIKLFLRIWYALPLLGVVALSVFVGMKEPDMLLFPFSLFYLIFGFIYFMLAHKKIIITDEAITVISGLKKNFIPYNRIENMDYRERKWVRGSPTYYVVKYADHKDISKFVYMNPMEYSKQNMKAIIQLVVEKM